MEVTTILERAFSRGIQDKKQFELFALWIEWEVVQMPCSVAVMGTMALFYIIWKACDSPQMLNEYMELTLINIGQQRCSNLTSVCVCTPTIQLELLILNSVYWRSLKGTCQEEWSHLKPPSTGLCLWTPWLLDSTPRTVSHLHHCNQSSAQSLLQTFPWLSFIKT